MRGGTCLFCGQVIRSRDHLLYCDGKQGKREAEINAALDPMPLLISGLDKATHDTSSDAAVRNDADARETQRAEVLQAIRATGDYGATDDELQAALNLDGSSERPRRWELWKLDAIKIRRDESGRAVKRETRTQRRAVVWVAIEQGGQL